MSLAVHPSHAAAAQEPKVYRCPGCGAALYSPYHTVCPVCAQPIDLEEIEKALGKTVDVASDSGSEGLSRRALIGLALVVVVVAVGAIAAAFLS